MSAARLAGSALAAYREEADRFLAALEEEYYLHFAGLKDELDVAPIYERYSDLTTPEACARAGAAAAEGTAGRELWRFACEGFLGALVREETEEIGRLETGISADVDGDTVGFRMLRPTIANEPKRDRRERLEHAREKLVEEHLNPRHVRVAEKRSEGTNRLGFPTYRELYEAFGFPLGELAAQCRDFLSETEDLYAHALDRLLTRRLGLTLEAAERWDVARLARAPEWDDGFPADGMLPALAATLLGLGIDLREQKNVHIDAEHRPKKTARAFCAPIEVPGRVMLVIQPIGGPMDWQALFHEAGHTEHFAHTSPDLDLEARRLGDNAVTEGWAALFELLVNDQLWLGRRLSVGRPHEFAAETAAIRLYVVRRYAAKFLYELELHSESDLDSRRTRYVEWMREATKIEPSPVDFVADVDPGFYSSSYLRSWAFEAQLRTHFREEFGSAWFAQRAAGSLLRELWSEGQHLSADELLRELTGGGIELEAVGERIREDLRS